ncbi:Mitochondrial dicarboxylate carrier [Hypsibius exemplaris]|uniref:Mitochondrial dicarboxylate carrier n=1 Tax=Hypsibius exemplaris TaxID=2072580 RepID=A0A1W0X5K2_HYPEX|nr:Mitochondrial dicarboxylate carrier [Hypsibius exemplaris]
MATSGVLSAGNPPSSPSHPGIATQTDAALSAAGGGAAKGQELRVGREIIGATTKEAPSLKSPTIEKSLVVQKNARWYHGGVASAMACCFTHPFDLVKVQLQTQQDGKLKIIPLTSSIVRQHGFLALYNGISASLLRQLTYSTARFGVYEALRPKDSSQSFSFLMKCATAGAAGGIGGLIGAPADLINVRMQNDSKLPVEARRNYKNAVEGLVRVLRQEVLQPFEGLFDGGQSGYSDDNRPAGLLRPSQAFTLGVWTLRPCGDHDNLPVDVLKTRMQNSRPGQYKSILHCVQEVAKSGPLGFFKGYIPAFVRLGPQTILTFVFLEQIRLRFGIPVADAKKSS